MKTDRETILKGLAPCGLDCSRCARYKDGEVRGLATELIERLEGFEKVAPKIGDAYYHEQKTKPRY
ncbi:MAG: DUF3795 domain-containing protein [Firmicutes bacterium]|nr:DUF3795 domain-containing protein [Bacillota bacterium]